MNVLSIIRIAFRALARNKMRAALTMLGIIIGVSAVIAMVSIGQGAQATVQAQIEGMGTNLLFVSAQAQNAGGVRGGAGADSASSPLTAQDLDAIRREVPSVSMVSPQVNSRAQLVAGNLNWSAQVQGVSHEFTDIRKWQIGSGAFFTDGDVRKTQMQETFRAPMTVGPSNKVVIEFWDGLCRAKINGQEVKDAKVATRQQDQSRIGLAAGVRRD